MFLGYAISLAYTPIMLRLLGQRQYGLYNLVASVVSYLGILNFGFISAYMRYYSRYKVKDEQENIARLNGMFVIIFTVFGRVEVPPKEKIRRVEKSPGNSCELKLYLICLT